MNNFLLKTKTAHHRRRQAVAARIGRNFSSSGPGSASWRSVPAPGIWVYQQSHRRCAAWALKPLWLPHPFGLHCNLRHPDRRFPPLPSLPAFAGI